MKDKMQTTLNAYSNKRKPELFWLHACTRIAGLIFPIALALFGVSNLHAQSLTGLSVSVGTLTPAFDAATFDYTATVPASTTSVTVTATAASGTLIDAINSAGDDVFLASVFLNSLNEGENTIKVEVRNGAVYTLIVTRQAPLPALTDLSISVGTLTPTFGAATFDYTATVPNDTATIKVTPAIAGSAMIAVGITGSPAAIVTSGEASDSIDLAVGENIITVVADPASSGGTSYTLTITRLAAQALTSLSISAGTLAPAFTPGTFAYIATVFSGITSIMVTSRASLRENTSVGIAGETPARVLIDADANRAVPIMLNEGDNEIEIIVIDAGDDTKTRTYTLTVTRLPPVPLTDISLSAGTLDPAFSTDEMAYTAFVSTITSITVTPTATSGFSGTITVGKAGNLETVTSGTASGPIDLDIGSNAIEVMVTSGGVTHMITLTVTRFEPPQLTILSSLGITLDPAFAATTFDYAATVPATTGTALFTLVANSNFTGGYVGMIAINGENIDSGTAFPRLNLTFGLNEYEITVTLAGEIATYNLAITRTPMPGTLTGLSLSTGTSATAVTFAPAFVPTTFNYTATVSASTSSVMVTLTASSGGTITVNNEIIASGVAFPVTLAEGNNVVIVKITGSGETRTYSLTITRPVQFPLAELSLSTGTLDPAFDASVLAYTAIVSNTTASLTVTPTAAGTITVDGTSVTSGMASGAIALAVGVNTVKVLITSAASAGGESTYTLTVTRSASPATLTSLSIPAASLFSSSENEFTYLVPNTFVGVIVTPTAPLGSIITINLPAEDAMVDVVTVASGEGINVGLEIGANEFELVVTSGAETNTYSLTIIRVAASNLIALSLSAGTPLAPVTFAPAFAPATLAYTATVPTTSSSITVMPTVVPGFSGTITINGTGIAANAALAVMLDEGENTIEVVVTFDGATTTTPTTTYSLTITRLAAAPLTALSLSASTPLAPFTFVPAFAPATFAYTVTVPASTTSLEVTPTAAGTITVNGDAVVSGTASGSIMLTADATTTITVVVTSGTETTTYTLAITHAPPSSLIDLSLSDGTLDPAFVATTFDYTATVSSATSPLVVTPTATAGSIITIDYLPLPGAPEVDGSEVASGEDVNLTLQVGENSFVVVVTSGAEITTYNLIITRPAAPLTGLIIDTGPPPALVTFTPEFAETTLDYASTVSGITNIAVIPTAASGNTITVDGTDVASGSASADIALAIGTPKIITVIVTSGDASITYTITITRIASILALAELSLSAGTLAPTFTADELDYTATVPTSTDSITVTPTAISGAITVNRTSVTSGSASTDIALVVGKNTIEVIVASNSAIRIYSLTVTRLAPALTGLSLSAGTLDPTFATDELAYTATVPNATDEITVTPTAVGTITVDGDAVVSGSASTDIALVVGKNTIEVIVTSGAETSTYTLTVTRLALPLTGLGLSAGVLTPAFSLDRFAYTATVSSATSTLVVTPTAAVGDIITVNAAAVIPGTASAPITLTAGAPTTITVLVTSAGEITSYTLTVTRAAPAAPLPTLTDLSLSAGTLVPSFSANRFTYTANVPNTTTSLTVTPTAVTGVAITVDPGTGAVTVTSGDPSAEITLTDDENTITVEATSGSNTGIYTLVVKRLASRGSGPALTDLVMSAPVTSTFSAPVTLTPAFNPDILSYTATVLNFTEDITVTPTAAAGDTITVDGAPVDSGVASTNIALVADIVGTSNSKMIEVIVTSGSEMTTYTLTVTRPIPLADQTDTQLTEITISNPNSGRLQPTFAADIRNYTAVFPNAVDEVTISPTYEANAAVTINEAAVASGSSATVRLGVGDNTISVVVSAFGLSQTFTLVVTRLELPALTGFTLTTGTDTDTDISFSPTFDVSELSYSADIFHANTSAIITPTAAAGSIITVNGNEVASGEASDPIALNIGNNVISIVVDSSGKSITYTLNAVRRGSLSLLPTLTGLSLSVGTLDPAFDADELDYTASVPDVTDSVTVRPSSSAGTTIAVGDETVGSGAASNPIMLTRNAETAITITVTSGSGGASTYTLTVTREPPLQVRLLYLSLSAGTLSPDFDPGSPPEFLPGALPVTPSDPSTTPVPVFDLGTLAYTAIVPSDIDEIIVFPTTALGDTVTVGLTGEAATAIPQPITMDPAAIMLAAGENTIEVIVTSGSGGEDTTYSLIVTRLAATPPLPTLTALSFTGGTFAPDFAADTIAYTANVLNGITSITVTPAATSGAITVNGNAVVSGAASAAVMLDEGENTITVVLTTSSSTNTYSLIVTRLALSLIDLSLSGTPPDALPGDTPVTVTFAPDFATDTIAYTANVPNFIASITVTPTAASDFSGTITVNGNAVASAAASAAVMLNVGENTITVAVASAGATTTTYTLTVTRALLPTLTDLSLSVGMLDPAFDANEFIYTATVPNATASITVTPTAASGDTITVGIAGSAADTVVSDEASDAITLNVGENTITVRIASGDESRRYRLTITRLTPTALTNLSLSAGTLTPIFATDTIAYTATVPNATASITVTPTAVGTITVDGDVVVSAAASDPVMLNVGVNTITVVVTSAGATTATYTLTVTRAPLPTLADLSLSVGTLTPAFDANEFSYTATALTTTTTITATPTASLGSIITISGGEVASGVAANFGLSIGVNRFEIIVSSGSESSTYTLVVDRLAPAVLTNLSLSAGTLDPTFASGSLAYTATVPITTTAITVTPTAVLGDTITVNTATVASGEASASIDLAVGENPITVIVTGNGETTTYNLIVTRLTLAALSSLSLSAGTSATAVTLTPTFASATRAYTASVLFATSSISITPTAFATEGITLTVDGDSATSAMPSSVALDVGENAIDIVVTHTSTSRTYTVTLTRGGSLEGLTIASTASFSGSAPFSLIPAFDSNTHAYTAAVDIDDLTESKFFLRPMLASGNSLHATSVAAMPSTINGGNLELPVMIGENAFTFVVRQGANQLDTPYTLTVNVASANLSALSLSAGMLTPAFGAAINAYTATVDVDSMTITAVTDSMGASLMIDGNPATSASPTLVALSIGINAINIVASEGSLTRTYTLTVTRTAPFDSLASLSLGTGTSMLTPTFAFDVFSYEANVAAATSSITFTPVATNAEATVAVTVGTAVVPLTPVAGVYTVTLGPATPTVVAITVTHPGADMTATTDDQTQSYSLTINRANPVLSALVLSEGTLAPVFVAGTIAYTAKVQATTSKITITATTPVVGATLTVDGKTATSGSPSNLALDYGANTALVVVTHAGEMETYTVIITRTDVRLTGLTAGGASLSPAFDEDTTTYSLSGISTATVMLTPTASLGSTITVTDATVMNMAATSGAVFDATLEAIGTPTTITLVVSGAADAGVDASGMDATETRTYTVTAVQGANTALSALTLAAGTSATAVTLTPAFVAATNAYTATVVEGTDSIMITATAIAAGASLTVDAEAATSGTASTVALKLGENTINIAVSHQGATETYTLTVTRTDATDPTVVRVEGDAGTYTLGDAVALRVVFSEAVTVTGVPTLELETGATDRLATYTSGSGTDTLIFTYTVMQDDRSSDLNYKEITSLDTAGGTIADSANSADLTLPALDNTNALAGNSALVVNPAPTIVSVSGTNGTYVEGDAVVLEIKFTQAVAVTGSLPTLELETGATDRTATYTSGSGTSTLIFTYTVMEGDLNDDLDYTSTAALDVSTTNIVEAPISANSRDAVLTLAAPGAANSLAATSNIRVGVLTQDHQLARIMLSAGTLAPVFAPDKLAYTATVPADTLSITVTPTAVGTITVNTVAVASDAASGPIMLAEGENTITVVVTSAGATTTYGLTITRLASLALTGIELSSGTLAPVFAETTLAYTATVDVAYVMITAAAESMLVSLTIDGNPATSASAATVLLRVGENPINIVVSQGGVERTYTLTVTRDAPVDSLTSLGLATGSTLTSTFAPDVFSYEANTTTATTSIKFTPVVTNAAATVAVTVGTAVVSLTPVAGVYTVPLETAGTPTVVTVTVTHPGTDMTATADDQTQVYSLTINRANTALSALVLSEGTLAPVFVAATNSYTAKVRAETSTITITATTPVAGASLTVDGETATSATASTVMLDHGDNTVLVVVTHAGEMETYTVTITRTDVRLTGLTAGGASLSPAFDEDTTTYSLSGISTATVMLTPTASLGSTITVTDATVMNMAATSGAVFDATLEAIGTPTTITLVVSSAADAGVDASGMDATETRTYTVTAVQGANTALSALTLAAGTPAAAVTPAPAFAAAINAYTATVAEVVDSITITATTAATAGASLTVDGEAATSAMASTVMLKLGENIISIAVTDRGAVETYTLTVTRADATDPEVEMVRGTAGTYTLGDAVALRVVFSEAVTVTGVPTLELETGRTDRLATYTSGSGTDTLIFTYTVMAGDLSLNLNYKASSLALAGGTIKDGSGNNADLTTLPAPTALATSAIIVNPTPTIVEVRGTNGTYTAGDEVILTVTFSKAVELIDATASASMKLSLETGDTDQTAKYTSGLGTNALTFTYTVMAGDLSDDLDYTSINALNAGTAVIVESPFTINSRQASLVLAAPGAANSLAATSNIRVGVDAETQNARLAEIALSKITQTITAHTVDALTGRFERMEAGSSGSTSQNFSSSLAQVLVSSAEDGFSTYNLKKLAGQANFSLAMGGASKAQHTPTFWVTGQTTELSDEEDGLDYEGTIYGLAIGLDGCIRPGLVAGFSLNLSDASFEYTDSSTTQSGDYNYEGVTVNPYIHWEASERLSLWGMVGLGEGDIETTSALSNTSTSTKADHYQLAAGVHYNLLESSRINLRLKGDMTINKLEIAASDGFQSDDISTERVRVAIEASQTFNTNGHLITPSVSVGIRYDGGDGDTGTGVELAGQVSWLAPESRVALELKGRYLAAGLVDEWGASFMTRVNVQKQGQGLTFSLGPTIGQTQSQSQRLWQQGVQQASASPEATLSLTTELAYGIALPARAAKLSPYARMSFGDGHQNLEIGQTLSLGQGFNLDMKISRKQSAQVTEPQAFLVEGRWKF